MLQIDVSNIFSRKKVIEPLMVEVQKNFDASTDDDDVGNDELNFNGPSTKRKRAKFAWIFQRQLESEFAVDYEIKPNYSSNQTFVPEEYFDSEIDSKPKPVKKKKAKYCHERD
ncbi:hypothetical protein BpHYR1_025277 [Brachionus plicatilis]|uniref:Uncharacterized protein n=1 Tax=Brachionus plicatilis TaxID=10195 RepID=A0A3M7SLQ7_BRAPC|nr:hypothetical protein BpHYR1_025277 [Brachionus plicatilis]